MFGWWSKIRMGTKGTGMKVNKNENDMESQECDDLTILRKWGSHSIYQNYKSKC